MNAHPSGYIQWLRQPISKREREDSALASTIRQCWLESGGQSGFRNIHFDLVRDYLNRRRDRVLRLMQQAGLRAVRGYRKPRVQHGGKPQLEIPNDLDRQFNVNEPNLWWVGYLTCIHTYGGFLFLAVVMDLFARNVVGWSMAPRKTDELVMDALTMAYWRRKPEQQVRFHSDQRSQYQSAKWKRLLRALNIKPSMSRRGNCHDNAAAENFFANLKKEKIRRTKYQSRE